MARPRTAELQPEQAQLRPFRDGAGRNRWPERQSQEQIVQEAQELPDRSEGTQSGAGISRIGNFAGMTRWGCRRPETQDRKSVVAGQSGSVRVDQGGRRK